jgi:ketosteroid isomerase-like protein
MEPHTEPQYRKPRSLLRYAMVAMLASGGLTVLGGASSSRAEIMTKGDHADSIAVASAVNQFHGALTKGDSVAALAFLAADALILENGALETRNEYRSHHLGGDIQFSRAVKAVRSPIKVIVAGETAWTAGTSATQGEFNGRTINTVGSESMVLSRTAAGWRIRSIHWSSRTRRPAS